MILDDGAADKEPDPHSVRFRGVEGVEELVHSLRIEPDSYILHSQTHSIPFVSFGPDHQLSRTILDAPHRVRGVQEQVEDDLLKLDAIARDRREVSASSAEESPDSSAIRLTTGPTPLVSSRSGPPRSRRPSC